jgi:hypothetical protein
MNGALRSILSRAQRVKIDIAGLAQDLRVAEFPGRRIAAPRPLCRGEGQPRTIV